MSQVEEVGEGSIGKGRRKRRHGRTRWRWKKRSGGELKGWKS